MMNEAINQADDSETGLNYVMIIKLN